MTDETPEEVVPRPAVDLRDRIAEAIRHDSFAFCGMKPDRIAEIPWETTPDDMRSMWLRHADSALRVLADD